jgi:hypothetical protein
VQVSTVDTVSKEATSVVCLFCINFGREAADAPTRKRKRTERVHYYSILCALTILPHIIGLSMKRSGLIMNLCRDSLDFNGKIVEVAQGEPCLAISALRGKEVCLYSYNLWCRGLRRRLRLYKN